MIAGKGITLYELCVSEDCYRECPENAECRDGRCQCFPGFALGPYNECYEGKPFFFLLFMQTLNGEKMGCKIYSIELFCCCLIHEIRRRLCFVKLLITKVNASRRHLKAFMHDFNFKSSRKLLSFFFTKLTVKYSWWTLWHE